MCKTLVDGLLIDCACVRTHCEVLISVLASPHVLASHSRAVVVVCCSTYVRTTPGANVWHERWGEDYDSGGEAGGGQGEGRQLDEGTGSTPDGVDWHVNV